MADTLPDADVVTLDRVVCCYPDAGALLGAAALRTRQFLALTYPRNRWHVRAVIAVQNLLRRLKGSEFRVFVHSPEGVSATLQEAGLARAARQETWVWIMEVYRRSGPSNGC